MLVEMGNKLFITFLIVIPNLLGIISNLSLLNLLFRYIFPTLFAKTSCMMNPFLYGLTNASLRQEFRQLWLGGCRKKIDHNFDQERQSRHNQSKYDPK
jgi:hypothetical protein